MTDVELALYVLIAATAVAAFASFILLGTRFASPRRLGWCLVLFALAIFAALGRYHYRLIVGGDRAEGVIEDLIPKRKSGLRPAVRFTTADGDEVRFTCHQGVSAGIYAVGNTVPVYYLPSDPPFAVVATWPSLWWPTFFGSLVGIVPLSLGAFLLRRFRPPPEWPVEDFGPANPP